MVKAIPYYVVIFHFDFVIWEKHDYIGQFTWVLVLVLLWFVYLRDSLGPHKPLGSLGSTTPLELRAELFVVCANSHLFCLPGSLAGSQFCCLAAVFCDICHGGSFLCYLPS